MVLFFKLNIYNETKFSVIKLLLSPPLKTSFDINLIRKLLTSR